MRTYQDLVKANEQNKTLEFVRGAIMEHKASEMYQDACDAYEYLRKRNTTIIQFQKLLYDISGQVVPDNISSNYKLRNNFFPKFIKQENAYLLGNGVTFEDDKTKEALGGDAFDRQLMKAGLAALWGAVSFCYYNNNKVDVFNVKEFVPLIDEETGALRAGIRFWQIDTSKPLRATLYEEDGTTEYMWKPDEEEAIVLQEKRPYILRVATSPVDGVEILDGRNYPSFPIVPLWANEERQSELVGLREKIDCYDLIQSGFADNVDDASIIYWTIQNAGGMDDIDLAEFVKKLRTVHAAVVDDNGAHAESHAPQYPTEARKAMLEELKQSLYSDAMAIDPSKIANSGVTNVAIRCSYADLDLKCDEFENCVSDCIAGLLAIVGIEDSPTYKRSMITNMLEDTQMVLQAAQYLDDETVLKHIPFITVDEIADIMERKEQEEADRYADMEAELEELKNEKAQQVGQRTPESGQEAEGDGSEADTNLSAGANRTDGKVANVHE